MMYGYQGTDVFSPDHQPFYGTPFTKPFIKQEHMDTTMRHYHHATMGELILLFIITKPFHDRLHAMKVVYLMLYVH